MMNPYSTLIVGGTYRIRDGRFLVQKRSWEMLRIFSDHLSSPLFGMLESPNDETLSYPLPDSVHVVRIPSVRGKRKLLNTALGMSLSTDLKKVVDGCYAVYLRQPLWECWDIFRYASSQQKKILVSYHGDWPDALRKSEAGTLRKSFNLALATYIHHTFKTMARRSDLTFCVGEELQAKYGRMAKNSTVFANFLHSANDIAEPRALTEGTSRVLFVGGFEEYKGTKFLIEAASLLKKRGVDFALTLVGAGSLESELRALVKSEGIEGNVEWLGYVQHGPALMDIYQRADIFVLPSIASEGTPKVLMEAMSQGVPVIATDVGSSRHLLDHGKYGLLVKPADASSIAAAIVTLLKDVPLRERFVEQGLELARASTKEKQMQIVRTAIQSTLPEIISKDCI